MNFSKSLWIGGDNVERVSEIMMNLIASDVCGKAIDSENLHLTDDDLKQLYMLSKKHDLAHLVGDALIRHKLLPDDGEIKTKFEKQIMTAVYRYERMNYELNNLSEALNQAKIPFIPLKGSVLRQYYPEPWKRTSCDIDILVHHADLDNAVKLLTEHLEYRAEAEQSHDIGMHSPGGVHVELHYCLLESNMVEGAEEVLETVWEQSVPVQGFPYRYVMSNEMFYYYHIAHMAKHFQIGGCGVRPFLDLWILNRNIVYNTEKLNALLEEGGLLTFAVIARQLAEVWFENGEHNAVTKETEKFILSGGVYGTMDNRVAVQQIRKGGKLRYAISRIWLPYDMLIFRYPSLEGKRILLPFYEVRRWGKLLFCGSAKRGAREMKLNSSKTKAEQSNINELLTHLGLLH